MKTEEKRVLLVDIDEVMYKRMSVRANSWQEIAEILL